MIIENSPNRLLVEGKGDQHSVIHLMKRHGIDWNNRDSDLPYIHDCDGISPLMDSLSVSAKTYRRLGILIDANSEPTNRWSQIRERFSDVGVTLPKRPYSDGTYVQGIDPNCMVGIWMMPDNSSPGRLEDFLATLVPAQDACWPYAKEATVQARKLGAKFSSRNQIKSCIHTWLAWQESPGLPFGTALTAAYFNHDSPVALKFAIWFKKLFLN